MILGVDVGGTFTDFVAWDGARLRTHKELSTPHDQSEAILRGLAALGAAGAEIVHGSTVATNALLERRGARAGLLTTAGFRDVLALGRQNRPHLYRLLQPPDPPLFPDAWRWEVTERLDAEGKVLEPLDEAALSAVADEIAASGVESLAIVFLFSFLNPAHEQRAAALLRERLPDVALTLSCELLPEYREFERSATCAINAYVRPPVHRYLSRLAVRLGDGTRLRVMQSNGGVIGATQAAAEAARLVLSGPAGGVVAAFHLAQQAEATPSPQLLTLDMGGTSTDVSLCPGQLLTSAESEIERLPLRLPVMDIHTVGAGGGSIAWVDAGGALRVGPSSAGSLPGPACYGRGGTAPTVTDATVVLGRLDPTRFLGGAMALDVEAARGAVARVAEPLGLTIEAAALGIVQVANAAMERALRRVSVERGHDPRGFTLLPFGGAGPLHACALAEALGIRRVLVPPQASVLSALGMLLAPLARDFSRALLLPLDSLDGAALAAALDGMQRHARAALAAEGIEAPEWQGSADCRYLGQSYELTVPLPLPIGEASRPALAEAFHAAHEQRYGARMARPIELVTLRLRAHAPASLAAPPPPPLTPPGEARAVGRTRLWFTPDAPTMVPTYERLALPVGTRLEGPALLLQPDTTTLLPSGWQATVDGFNNLSLCRGAAEAYGEGRQVGA